MNSETSAALAVMLLAALSLVVLILLITAAPADTVCLSKAEARKLWPTAHLHWYSLQHCWSNRRGPPRDLKFDPIPNNKDETQKKPRRKSDEDRTYRQEEFNPLDAQADRDTYFGGEPIETWASVTRLNIYRQFTPWDERIDGSLK